MKYFSDNLLMLILSFVLGLSSMQGAYASANKCMMTEKNMQSQMQIVNMNNTDMKQTGDKNSCCQEHKCTTTHCANSSVIATTSNNTSNLSYLLSTVFIKQNTMLLPFYSSSLYRPPKI